MRFEFTTLALFLGPAVGLGEAHEGQSVHHHNGQHEEHHHDHNQLRPHTHIAYHHVESACAADVEALCGTQGQLPLTLGDPFLDWIFLPSAASPPGIEDMSRVIDQVLASSFVAPVTQISLYWYEEPQEVPHFLIDSTAAKLASEKEPEEIPELARQIQEYGEEMILMHEEGSMGHQMARRLTQMDATTIQHNVHLPFGCQKNRCLREMMDRSRVSNDCAKAIQQLETTYVLEVEMERRQEMFVGMMWIYIGLLFALLVLLTRRYRAHRSQRHLHVRILQAVYSSPALKSQVEAELGQSVGNVPPVPYYALKLMSLGGKEFRRHLICMKRVHMLFFACLLTLVFVAPFWVLPICIVVSLFRVINLCLLSVHSSERECECCCCGASTTDAANRNLTEAQACCGCCKGTGVCSPSCASCCGTDGGCCCGCCDGSCNCCAKESTCCGKQMKTQDDCTCCCCGATQKQVRDGTLTDTQVCCTCCKGTGVCDPSCASCCSGGCCCCCGATEKAAVLGKLTEAQACCACCAGTGCCSCCSCCAPAKKGCCAPAKNGRGQKHIFESKKCIYQGVPVQIV